jgi:LPXTG-motif cell wall-anchored protein
MRKMILIMLSIFMILMSAVIAEQTCGGKANLGKPCSQYNNQPIDCGKACQKGDKSNSYGWKCTFEPTGDYPNGNCVKSSTCAPDSCGAVPEFGSSSTGDNNAYYLTIIGIIAVVAVAFIALKKKK